jgi:hypothetical protein
MRPSLLSPPLDFSPPDRPFNHRAAVLVDDLDQAGNPRPGPLPEGLRDDVEVLVEGKALQLEGLVLERLLEDGS